jgi:hypothetical protein
LDQFPVKTGLRGLFFALKRLALTVQRLATPFQYPTAFLAELAAHIGFCLRISPDWLVLPDIDTEPQAQRHADNNAE